MGLKLWMRVISAEGLRAPQSGRRMAAYFTAKIIGVAPSDTYQSAVIYDTLNPVWNEEFIFNLDTRSANDILEIRVLDLESIRDDEMVGLVEIPLGMYLHQNLIEERRKLMTRKARSFLKQALNVAVSQIHGPADLHYQICFGPDTLPNVIPFSAQQVLVTPPMVVAPPQVVVAPPQQQIYRVPAQVLMTTQPSEPVRRIPISEGNVTEVNLQRPAQVKLEETPQWESAPIPAQTQTFPHRDSLTPQQPPSEVPSSANKHPSPSVEYTQYSYSLSPPLGVSSKSEEQIWPRI